MTGRAIPTSAARLQDWLQRRESRLAIAAGNRLSDVRYLIWRATHGR